MADPLPPDEPYLSTLMRVQRGVETAQELINAFPALEQAALNSSSASGGARPGLTEQDCRRLLDLPDAEEEAANIRRVSARSHAELVSTVLSRPGDLSDAELGLFAHRFWANVTLRETETALFGKVAASAAVQKRVDEARYAAAEVAPLESLAYSKVRSELSNRRQRRETARLLAHQRHTTPAWMDDVARQVQNMHEGMNVWGFIALFDAEVQETTSAEERYWFERAIGDVLRPAMTNNGARAKAIALKWRLHFFDAPYRPSTTTTAAGPSSSPDEPDYHTALRSAFHAVLDSAECKNMLHWDQGVRTDMFLVVNKECIDSLLGRYLDDMRIMAYEATLPPADGYDGRTWVRLEQLVYRFYGAACTSDDVKMHDIWRAAQVSKHQAFVSLDPEVAQGWSMSTSLSGQRQPRYDVHF
jgi:hypothetical protein